MTYIPGGPDEILCGGDSVTETGSALDIEEMESWTAEERLAFWTKEFDRCIR